MSRGYKRATLIAMVVVSLLAVMVATAFAADPNPPYDVADPPGVRNDDCLACHEDASRMATSTATTAFSWDLATVNKQTACRKCHTMDLMGTHPYHNVGMPCSGCHNGWGSALFSAIPSYKDVNIGSFAAASSIEASSDVLHQIHMVPRWAGNADTADSRCGSCHKVAACSACHSDVASMEAGLHGSHPSSGSWTGQVANGIVSSQTEYTVTTASNKCGTAGCHDIAGASAKGPVNKENATALNTAVVYTPVAAWRESYKSSYTYGRMSYSGTTGAYGDFTFTGQQVVLVGDKDPYRGYAEIYIDPATNPTPVATISLYAPNTKSQLVLFTSANLGNGEHVLRVRVTGTKETDARAAFVSIDQFKVMALADGRFASLCMSCHNSVTYGVPHEDGGGTAWTHDATQTATATYQLGSYDPVTCETCHQMRIGKFLPNEHERTTASTFNNSCTACHTTLGVPTDGSWGYDGTCSYSTCHTSGVHSFSTGNHTVLSDVADPGGKVCRSCHAGDLAAVHDNSITTNDAYMVTGCDTCHTPTQYPTSKSCVEYACHSMNSMDDHPAAGTAHDASASQPVVSNSGGYTCVTCHDDSTVPTNVNLQPEHAKSSTTGGAVSCTTCHSKSYFPVPWDTAGGAEDKNCDDCHAAGQAANPIHGAYATQHTPDSGSQTSCSTGTGCHGTDMGTMHVNSIVGNTSTPTCVMSACHAANTTVPTLKTSCAATGCHPAYTHGSEGTNYHVVPLASNTDCNSGCHANGTTLMGLHSSTCATCHNNPTRDPANPNLTWNAGTQLANSSCTDARCHSGYTTTSHSGQTGIDASHTADAIATAKAYGGALDATGTACTSYCHLNTMGGGDLVTKGEHDWVRDSNGGDSDGNIVTCLECHTSAYYTTNGGGATFRSSKNCTACHTDFSGAGNAGDHGATPHDFSLDASSTECWGGCHTTQAPVFTNLTTVDSGPTNIAELHSNASTTVASVTYTGCNVCHRDGATVLGSRSGTLADSCWDCHNPSHAESSFNHLTASSAMVDDGSTTTGCTGSGSGCHDTTVNIGFIHTGTDYAGCTKTTAGTCHNIDGLGAEADSMNLGNRECIECHNATLYPQTPNAYPVMGLNPNGHYSNGTTHTATAFSSTSLSADSTATASAACSDCHKTFSGTMTGLYGIHQGVPSTNYGAAITCYECHTNPSAINIPSTSVVNSSWDVAGTADDRKCTACHTPTSAAPAGHAAALPTVAGSSTLSCGSYTAGRGCHSTTNLHALHRDAGTGVAGCSVTDAVNGGAACHDTSVQVAKPTATTCGGASAACHKDYLTPNNANGNHNLIDAATEAAKTHEASSTYMATKVDSGGAYQKDCTNCHSAWLRTEHATLKTTGTLGTGGVLCYECHVSSTTGAAKVLNNWDNYAKNCAGAGVGCHTLNASHSSQTNTATAGMHAITDSALTSGGTTACSASGCHLNFNTNVAAWHSEAESATPGWTSCNVCHVNADGGIQNSRTKTAGSSAGNWDCVDCHPDRVVAHIPDHLADKTGTFLGVTYDTGRNVGCFNATGGSSTTNIGCHYVDLRLEHGSTSYGGANRTMDAATKGSSTSWCTVCHTSADKTFDAATAGTYAGSTAVRAAVLGKDRRCVTCHNQNGADSASAGVQAPHMNGYAAAPADGANITPQTLTTAPNSLIQEFQDWSALTGRTGGGHNSYATLAYPTTNLWTWSATMKTGWDGGGTLQNQKVLCGDCHAGTGGAGPQGASVPYGILQYAATDSLAVERTNVSGTAWSPSGVTNRTNAVAGDWYNGTGPYFIPNGDYNGSFQAPGLCGKCHGTLVGPFHGGNGGHDFPYAVKNQGSVNSPPCIMCHIKIPHAWKRPRLLRRVVATTNTGVPVAYRGADALPYADPSQTWTDSAAFTHAGFRGPTYAGLTGSAGCNENVCEKHGATGDDLWP